MYSLMKEALPQINKNLAKQENKKYFEKMQTVKNKTKFGNVMKEVNKNKSNKTKIAKFIERHTNNGMTIEQTKNLVEKMLILN